PATSRDDQPLGDSRGWGEAGHTRHLWTGDYLSSVKAEMASHGLELVAVENFDPADWWAILLDDPRREEQIETVKQHIRMLGEVGIAMLGYNFSITGVASRLGGRFARGQAHSVGMDGVDTSPLPGGLVWNMSIPGQGGAPSPEPASEEELWSRWRRFMDEVLPVAEATGVALAAHPDDPPVTRVRHQPKFGWSPERYLQILEDRRSPFNRLELCLGTLAEMADVDLYATLEAAARSGRIGYVHLRNVTGAAPHYHETFIDEGTIDVDRAIGILAKHGFQGVIVPDHTPMLTCDAPWHAGMAFAMGYIKAALDRIAKRSF
ncbi:MAG: mannonate dehydratase, partial [Spirochaeta sp.]|nr:mannonate dehydratase [Spirochaeta sp.]